MSEPFDPYYEWLGIPPKDQPPHVYRLLGLDLYEANSKVIEAAAEQRMLLLRTRQSGKNSADSQRLLNEVSQAQRLLHDAARKQSYDHELRIRLNAISATGLAPPAPAPMLPTAVLSPSPLAPASPRIVAKKPAKRRPNQMPILLFTVGGAVALLVLLGLMALLFRSPEKPQIAEQKPPVADGAKSEATTPALPTPVNRDPQKTKSVTKVSVLPTSSTEPTKNTSDPIASETPAEPAVPFEFYDWYAELRNISLDKPDAWTKIAELYTLAAPKNLHRNERCILFRRLVDFAERLLEHDQLPLAQKLLSETEPSLVAANYPVQAARAARLRAEIESRLVAFQPAESALAKLQTDPNDVKAAQLAGSYLCFAKNDWPRGLPLLRKCNDAKLKKLATDDLALPTKPLPQRKLADAWWEFASTLPATEQANVRLRAGQWYREALAGLKGADLDVVRRRVLDSLRVGLAQLDSPAKSLAEAGSELYLDDLEQDFSAQVFGSVGRHGLTGSLPETQAVVWEGKQLSHSLFMHPPSNGAAVTIYRLGGGDAKFRGKVGIAESSECANPSEPAVFRVFGDDRLLWESKPQQRRGASEPFEIDVSHVDMLRLETVCLGDLRCCHAIWIDPEISGGLYRAPTWSARARRGNEIYLDDLQETGAVVGYGRFVGGGSAGNTVNQPPLFLTDNGRRLLHGLVMVPASNAKSEASYQLGGRYREFSARMGLGWLDPNAPTVTPLTYVVLGDGRELWKSPEFSQPNRFEECVVNVTGVKELRIEARCPGSIDGAWATWGEPRLEPADPQLITAARPAAQRADRVVIWNTHNTEHRDRGTNRCNLLLYHGTQLVWQQTAIRLPWQEEMPGLPVAIPSLEFDRLRVEMTDLAGMNGAGLAEIEVFRGNENISRKAIATSSRGYQHPYLNYRFIAPEVNDGVTHVEGDHHGYLLMDDAAPGWVEMEWRGAETKTVAKLGYPLRAHPHTAVEFQGHWYVYYSGAITWQAAQQQCRELGGYLCCIESAGEDEFIGKLAEGREVWLGLQRDRDNFVWLNGATADYRNWNTTEPNNLTANEDFGDMLPNGRWNDAPDQNGNNRGFICEFVF